jgi:hypothetical protein
MRRSLTEDEQHKIADVIVVHLEQSNWKIERGPALEGHGPHLMSKWSRPFRGNLAIPGGRSSRYFTVMAISRADGFVDPCIPTLGAKPPSGADWVHEIKHDGYRYPAIAGAAAKLRARSFTWMARRWSVVQMGWPSSMRSTDPWPPKMADDAFGFLCRSPGGPEAEKSETELPDSTE